MGKLKKFSKATVTRLLENDNYTCHYCRIPIFPRWELIPEYLDSGERVIHGDIKKMLPHIVVSGCHTAYPAWDDPQGNYFEIHYEPGIGVATVDHIVPRAKGGTDEISNLIIACGCCNSQKHSTFTYEEFKEKKRGDG